MIQEKKLEYLTSNFRALQGLRAIPVGLFFLFTSAVRLHWISVPEGDLDFTIPIALLAIIASVLIRQYYKRTFGFVKKNEKTFREFIIGIFILAFLIFAGSIDSQNKIPIYCVGLAIAVLCILFWLFTPGNLRFHYLIIGLIVALISCLPSLNLFPKVALRHFSSLFFACILIIGGLFDHLVLVRHLHAIPKETNDEFI